MATADLISLLLDSAEGLSDAAPHLLLQQQLHELGGVDRQQQAGTAGALPEQGKDERHNRKRTLNIRPQARRPNNRRVSTRRDQLPSEEG